MQTITNQRLPDRALLKAIRENDLQKVQNLLVLGADFNQASAEPVRIAIQQRYHTILKLFLLAGFKPNDHCSIAFSTAIKTQNPTAFKLLRQVQEPAPFIWMALKKSPESFQKRFME